MAGLSNISANQGAISGQLETIRRQQESTPLPQQQPEPVETKEEPTPPPAETGRGSQIDITA